MVPSRRGVRSLSYSVCQPGEGESCESLRTPLVCSLLGEELYSSRPLLAPLLLPPSALLSGLTAPTMDLNKVLLMGRLRRSPRRADWPEDAIYDRITLHKQATHNVPV